MNAEIKQETLTALAAFLLEATPSGASQLVVDSGEATINPEAYDELMRWQGRIEVSRPSCG